VAPEHAFAADGQSPEAAAALRDLERRTLSALSGEFSKLVYLSSTRDYNTGHYQHSGLALRYGAAAAAAALARSHQAVFEKLLYGSLADLVGELSQYIDSTAESRDQILDTWQNLQAYRVLIPETCDPLSAELFASNVTLALKVLKSGPRVPGR
jgi:hypothetical protein